MQIVINLSREEVTEILRQNLQKQVPNLREVKTNLGAQQISLYCDIEDKETRK